MPDNTPSKPAQNNKPNAPAKVEEPDNTRPPNEPTPRNPMKPESVSGAADEEPRSETQGA